MDAKKNGASPANAIPATYCDNGYGHQVLDELGCSGLTKREAFAMAAMQGREAHWLHGIMGIIFPKVEAFWCVRKADALLAELAKEA